MTMLRLVEPFVTYGAPTLKTVRELVYKRGHGKVSGNRIRLTDNAIIEATLGQFGIICVEDLIHEIYTVGPHFKEASNFLWPFKLNNPTGGWVDKRNHFVDVCAICCRCAIITHSIYRAVTSVTATTSSTTSSTR